MLRDAYEIDKFFMEIQTLTSEMDPQPACIDELLDDDELYQMVRSDLEQRHTQTAITGAALPPLERFGTGDQVNDAIATRIRCIRQA